MLTVDPYTVLALFDGCIEIASKRSVRTPQRVFCTIDHIVDTRESSHRAKINLFDIGDENQGISHVTSPELGIALPGATLVCPDSHTCTLGGLGALAWGIGSTDAEHAMATNSLRVKKPKTMRITFEGFLNKGVFAKDMILHLIGLHGVNGGSGYMIEFAGQAIRNLPIEARMTLCNMAVEFSGFSGIVAPDQQTFDYVLGRDYAPGASGNIVTEDLVFLLESMGLKTGIDLEALFKVRELVQTALPNEEMYGFTPAAGLPLNWPKQLNKS